MLRVAGVICTVLLLSGCGRGSNPGDDPREPETEAPPAAASLPSPSDAGNNPQDEEVTKRARQADFQAQVQLGREALEAKLYEEAVTALTESASLLPLDDTTRRLLKQAQEAKRQADYEKAMARGREALTARNYEAASAAFSEALQRIPGDQQATALRAEAEFPLRMQQGRTALEGKRFAAAEKAFAAANQLKPEDPDCRALPQQAQGAHREQVKAEYDRAMTTGRNCLNARSYLAAFESFTQALRLVPGDDAAIRAFRDAERISPSGDFEAGRLRQEAEAKKRRR